MIGRTFGRFLIEAPLGRGGMATVWRASDPLMGQPVALKLISDSLSRSSAARSRFFAEAENGRRLDHLNVVPVIDAGEQDAQLWIAFPLIEGETLADRIARAPMDPAEAARIVAEAADGVEHAHGRGVLHRDVTSRNIMVGRDGRVLVLDFGLSRALDAETFTSSGTLMGTPSFIAPEVARGGRAGTAADVWGLGIVLYEALTGRLPFRHDRTEALIFAILNEPIAPPSSLRAGLAAEWDVVVARALERDPVVRVPSAKALAEELRRQDRLAAGRAETVGEVAEGTAPFPSVREVSREFLAILPFEDIRPSVGGSMDAPPLGPGLAAAVATALGAQNEIIVIETQTVDAGPSTSLSAFARAVGANRIIKGTVRSSGADVRVSWRLLDPYSMVQIHAGSVDGFVMDPLTLEDRLVASVFRGLGIEPTIETRKNAIRRDPAAAERYQQALGYLQRHDHVPSVDGAIGILERLVETEEPSAEFLATLGRAYLFKRRLTHEREWEARAAKACERALTLDSRSPGASLTLAELSLETGQHERALAAFQEALERRPGQEAWIGCGRALESLGRLEEAELALQRAVAIRPEAWNGYQWLGLYYFHVGRHVEAVATWRRALEFSPDNARTLANLGAACFELRSFDEAIEFCERSIRALPSPRAYANLGTALIYQERFQEAVQVFEKAVGLQPNDPEVWGYLGSACRLAPGFEVRAREALSQAVLLMRDRLSRNESDQGGWALQSGWLANLGRFDEGHQAIERALALAPEDVSVAVHAVGAYQSMFPEKAIFWLRFAANRGYPVQRFRDNPALGPLRSRPEFESVLRTLEEGK